MRRACAALLLIGCFSSDPGNRRFPCDETHGCPTGQTCQNNLCQDSAAPLDASGSNFDIASSLDMSMPRCSGNGYAIGKNGVWACLGTFSPANPASSLCSNGKICGDISTLLTASECTSAANALYGESPASGATSLVAKCATTTGTGWGSLWYGCGVRQNPKSESATTPCRGFTQIHFCSGTGFVCDLSAGVLDKQTNTDPLAGVLCCP